MARPKKGIGKLVLGISLFFVSIPSLAKDTGDGFSFMVFSFLLGIVLAVWGIKHIRTPAHIHEERKKEKQRRREVAKRKRENYLEDLKKQEIFKLESPRLYEIIEESLELIAQTKNLNTAIGRLDLLKDKYKRLLEIAPRSERDHIKLTLPDKKINRSITHLKDLTFFDELKKEYIRNFHMKKIDSELLKAKSLSEPKLKATQLKKALRVVLNALDDLPDDLDIKAIISNIEAQLK